MLVTKEDFLFVAAQVKVECQEAIESLIAQLDHRFPDSSLLNALGIVFPHYWLKTDAEEAFQERFTVFPFFVRRIQLLTQMATGR
ncbi:unnamed protein product [Calypogeia fissa]